MRITGKAVLDLVSIVGAVTLFGAWAYQQTLLNEANGRLRGIDRPSSVRDVSVAQRPVQRRVRGGAGHAQSEIRRFQVLNYTMALDHLKKPLTPEEQARLPAAPRPFDGDWNVATAVPQMQKRIEAVQTTLHDRKQEVAQNSATANRVFLIWYAAGSLLILAVGIAGYSCLRKNSGDRASGNGPEFRPGDFGLNKGRRGRPAGLRRGAGEI